MLLIFRRYVLGEDDHLVLLLKGLGRVKVLFGLWHLDHQLYQRSKPWGFEILLRVGLFRRCSSLS